MKRTSSEPQKELRREVALGPHVATWLRERGFEVYQEVEAWAGVADMVGVGGPLLVVVELKVALSWELLHQATRWRGVAHQVWVAVPWAKPSDGRSMARRVFEGEGVGILEVKPWVPEPQVVQTAPAALRRRAVVDKIRSKLREEQKTFVAAGSPGGAHWTEFKSTCWRLRQYLASKPEGVTMREIVAEVKHHYASDRGARARLVDLISRGIIEGLRAERGLDGEVMVFSTAQGTT